MYILLTGAMPIEAHEQEAIFAKIRAGTYDASDRAFGGVSQVARQLVARMLTPEPSKRITAREALTHPWVLADSLPSGNLVRAQARQAPAPNPAPTWGGTGRAAALLQCSLSSSATAGS